MSEGLGVGPSTDDKMILFFFHFQGQWSLHLAQSNIIITCKRREWGQDVFALQLKPILPTMAKCAYNFIKFKQPKR